MEIRQNLLQVMSTGLKLNQRNNSKKKSTNPDVTPFESQFKIMWATDHNSIYWLL